MCFHYYLETNYFVKCVLYGFQPNLETNNFVNSMVVPLMEPTMCFHYYLQSYWFLNV